MARALIVGLRAQGHGAARSAEGALLASLGVARELQGAFLMAQALTSAGVLSCQFGELDEALLRAWEALDLYKQLDQPVGVNHATLLSGDGRGQQGLLDEARDLLEQAGQVAQVAVRRRLRRGLGPL